MPGVRRGRSCCAAQVGRVDHDAAAVRLAVVHDFEGDVWDVGAVGPAVAFFLGPQGIDGAHLWRPGEIVFERFVVVLDILAEWQYALGVDKRHGRRAALIVHEATELHQVVSGAEDHDQASRFGLHFLFLQHFVAVFAARQQTGQQFFAQLGRRCFGQAGRFDGRLRRGMIECRLIDFRVGELVGELLDALDEERALRLGAQEFSEQIGVEILVVVNVALAGRLLRVELDGQQVQFWRMADGCKLAGLDLLHNDLGKGAHEYLLVVGNGLNGLLGLYGADVAGQCCAHRWERAFVIQLGGAVGGCMGKSH